MPAAPTLPVVHKFGGAALADASAIHHAAAIVARQPGPVVVVASAMRGVTDRLLELTRRAHAGDVAGVARGSRQLREEHALVVAALRVDDAARRELEGVTDAAFDELARMADAVDALRELTPATRDALVARGERLSARLLAAALVAAGVRAEFVDATQVLHADGPHGNAFPDLARTAAAAAEVLEPLLARGVVPVVPGFIARGPTGATVTLGRGGSDLSATALGRALGARDVVLWKDVPGLLTADPRVVPDARVIPTLDVREAAELAYHGARVLHPRALIALAERARLHVRPFAEPEAPGTLVRRAGSRTGPSGVSPAARASRAAFPVRALAAVGDQALVTVIGNGMLGVPGVAARAFGALERAGISVSLISQASSEHSICIGVAGPEGDAAAAALRAAFAPELATREIETVELRRHMATVAVVGRGMAGTPGIAARLFGAVAEAGVSVVAIAQGASELNISIVVEERGAAAVQRAVHAAFQLDKIGGGLAHHVPHADVVLLGFGQIGREFAVQLSAGAGRAAGRAPRAARQARIVAVIDRSGYVFEARGLGARRLAELAEAKRRGTPLAAARGGTAATAEEALSAVARHALSRPILVDATAGDTGPVLLLALSHGMDLVLANKRPLADLRGAVDGLARSAAATGRRVLHEATVGAGLPLLDTIRKLHEAGDRVLRIEGCPSGTLGFLFGELGRGVRFSVALREAMVRGYTEPDPRDDLSGADVARKALILARLLGYPGELTDVRVASLVPADAAARPLDEFLHDLPALDAAWARRVAAASAEGRVLRYRVRVSRRSVRIGVVAVGPGDALARLSGSDNQFAITTRRYRTNPLVITGPGAGAAVTAAGVLNDVLQLAGAR